MEKQAVLITCISFTMLQIMFDHWVHCGLTQFTELKDTNFADLLNDGPLLGIATAQPILRNNHSMQEFIYKAIAPTYQYAYIIHECCS